MADHAERLDEGAAVNARPRDRGWIVLGLIALWLVGCIGQVYLREML